MVAHLEPTVEAGNHLLLPLVEDEEGVPIGRCDGAVDAVEEAVEARLLVSSALRLVEADVDDLDASYVSRRIF